MCTYDRRHPFPRRVSRLLALSLLGLTACTGHGRARELLKRGQWDAVLESVRPSTASAYRLRARAWMGKGNLEQAQVELTISISLEDDSAESHRLLARLQQRLGNQGGELRQLERAFELDDHQPPESRRRLAELLRRRARLCADSRLGLACGHQAKQDLARAKKLDPAVHRPPASTAGSGAPAPTEASCPGVPREHEPIRIPATGPCDLRRVRIDASIATLARRHLLLACEGVQVARHLERHGCLVDAANVWRRLAGEAPGNPRWPFEQARVQLALGRPERAILMLQDHRYLSADRAWANRHAARLMLSARQPRAALKFAIEALSLTSNPEEQLRAIRLILAAGGTTQARQAAQTALERHGGSLSAALGAELRRLATDAPTSMLETPEGMSHPPAPPEVNSAGSPPPMSPRNK